MRYQRRDVNTWLDLFERQEESGLSAVAFCRQHQINIQTFYARRSDIRLQRASNKFVHVKREVTTIESRVENDLQALSLECASSTLRLPVNVSPHWLLRMCRQSRKLSATHAISLSATRCLKTYRVNSSSTIFPMKKKSVIAAQVRCIALARINLRSFSLSLLRLK